MPTMVFRLRLSPWAIKSNPTTTCPCQVSVSIVAQKTEAILAPSMHVIFDKIIQLTFQHQLKTLSGKEEENRLFLTTSLTFVIGLTNEVMLNRHTGKWLHLGY